MSNVLIRIDHAGRLVLPKAIREELAIRPGDLLQVAVQGSSVVLDPNTDKAGFARRGKALVFCTVEDDSLRLETVEALLDSERTQQHRRTAGRLASAKRRP